MARLNGDRTVIEGFGTLGDWTISGGTAELETANAKSGGALKLTSGVGTSCYGTKTISRSFLSDPNLRFWVYVPVLADVASIQVIVSSSATFATYFSKTLASTTLHEGWNRVHLTKSDFAATGAESWANTMVRLRARVNAQAGAAPWVIYDEMDCESDRPVVVVSFDDGWASAHTYGYAYMSALGLKGTMYLPGEKTDTAGYLTDAQAAEMYAGGWDFCNHTYSHTNLTTLADHAAMVADIKAGADYLYSRGFHRNECHRHLAYPNGGYDSTVLGATKAAGCLTARTVISAVQPHDVLNPLLLTRQVVVDTHSLADAVAFVDRAIAAGGATILNFHKLVAGAPAAETEWNEADFLALMRYLAAKRNGNLLDVLTVTEWYRQCQEARREA
jgi:peptidoglycan/xylan/chitin deacetylase (PgdA/CDA1 family)